MLPGGPTCRSDVFPEKGAQQQPVTPQVQSNGHHSLAQAVGELLQERHITLAVPKSCTGGLQVGAICRP